MLLASWMSAQWLSAWHAEAGLLAGACVLLRWLWGLSPASHRAARPALFVRSPGVTWAYLRAMRQGRERRCLGHNPLGAWMACTLWGMTVLCAASGWLYSTDAFWGEPWLDQLHRVLAWSLPPLVGLHLAGVLFTSRRHRENLPLAMLTGRKRLGRRPP